MNTNLRQANTKITAVGLLTEKKMEIKADTTGVKHIEGTVTVKTSDKNFVTFTVYNKEKKKDGGENKAYAGLVTVMNEFKSVAEVGEDEADYIRVNGQLNPYRGQNGNEIIGYRASFLNRIKQVDNITTEATFETEMFIQSILPEVDKEGEETGRMKVTGWLPTYAGIEPIELIAPEDLADALADTYEPGQTVEFYGDVINNRIVETIEKPVAFGKPKKETRSTYVNELILTGGSDPYDDEESEDENENNGKRIPYKVETIRAAIQERENEIAAEKAGANKKTGTGMKGGSKPSGAKHGRVLNLDI